MKTYEQFTEAVMPALKLQQSIGKAKDVVDSARTLGSKNSSIGDKVVAVAGNIPKVGTALTAGAKIGQAYKNTNRAPAVSGRGAGRATFNNNSSPGAKLDPT